METTSKPVQPPKPMSTSSMGVGPMVPSILDMETLCWRSLYASKSMLPSHLAVICMHLASFEDFLLLCYFVSLSLSMKERNDAFVFRSTYLHHQGLPEIGRASCRERV